MFLFSFLSFAFIVNLMKTAESDGRQEMGSRSDASLEHALPSPQLQLCVFKWFEDLVLLKDSLKKVAYFNDTECVFN